MNYERHKLIVFCKKIVKHSPDIFMHQDCNHCIVHLCRQNFSYYKDCRSFLVELFGAVEGGSAKMTTCDQARRAIYKLIEKPIREIAKI